MEYVSPRPPHCVLAAVMSMCYLYLLCGCEPGTYVWLEVSLVTCLGYCIKP